MSVERLVDEGQMRRDEWQNVLEPAAGASFDIFVQNPYSRTAEPDLYRRRIRISRACKEGEAGALRLEPLNPSDAASPIVFGDDEIYVANYQDRPPYDFARPYYYPIEDADFLKRNRPPSRLQTFVGALGRCSADGCFHTLVRNPVFAEPPAKLLRRRSTPLAAPEFGVAMTYAVARRTLDIWKIYLGWDEGFDAAIRRPFAWWFGKHLPRLEIVPFIKDDPADIAVSGFGYVQLGSGPDSHHTSDLFDTAAHLSGNEPPGSTPYWLNADVLAHELGHHLLYTKLGFGPQIEFGSLGPDWFNLWAGGTGAADPNEAGDPFRAFHEAFSDIVAIMVSLHDRAFLDAILLETKGDIFTVNAATSVGEVSGQKTIRNTFNNMRLADVRQRVPGDPPAKRYYQMSQVISGALFDIMAGFAARYLDLYAALPAETAAAWESGQALPPEKPVVGPGIRPSEVDLLGEEDLAREAAFRDAITGLYSRPNGPEIVAAAVMRARDALGRLLGGYLTSRDPASFDPARFTLVGLREDLAEVAIWQPSGTIDGATKAEIVRSCFAWRGI